MLARPWRNMVWSSASSTLIGPFVFAFVIWFSPNPSCSVLLVRPEGIVASTPFRATDLRLFFDVMEHIPTVHRASSSAIHRSAWRDCMKSSWRSPDGGSSVTQNPKIEPCEAVFSARWGIGSRPIRSFHTVSPGTRVHSPSTGALNFCQWHHLGCARDKTLLTEKGGRDGTLDHRQPSASRDRCATAGASRQEGPTAELQEGRRVPAGLVAAT